MKKVLQRDPNNKMIGGVCGGLGNYFDADPLLFRAIFLCVFFVGGSGLLLYIILWIVMPQGPRDIMNTNQTFEERNTPPQRENTPDQSDKIVTDPDSGSISVGLMLLSAGILLLVNNLVPGFNFKKFWPVILIIVGGGLMLGHRKLRSSKENLNEPVNEESQ